MPTGLLISRLVILSIGFVTQFADRSIGRSVGFLSIGLVIQFADMSVGSVLIRSIVSESHLQVGLSLS